MCGIYCCLRRHNNSSVEPVADSVIRNFAEYLKHRGPDGFSKHNISIEQNWIATFAGSVLWMQGSTLTAQPLICKGKHILLWNGDIFNGSMLNNEKASDTTTLSQKLSEAEDGKILKILTGIRGPYSFIYLDIKNKCVYFGRDRLGRHSLLWSSDHEGGLILTSVGRRNVLSFQEVPAVGIFMVDVSGRDINKITLHPWSDISADVLANINKEIEFRVEIATEVISSPIVPCRDAEDNPEAAEYSLETLYDQDIRETDQIKCFMNTLLSASKISSTLEKLLRLLKSSVEVRVKTQPGLCRNCIKWARIRNYCSLDSEFPKSDYQDMKWCPRKYGKYFSRRKVISLEDLHTHSIVKESTSVNGSKTSSSVDAEEWHHCVINRETLKHCNHSKIGVLFSGGLDSTLLAALANEFVPLSEPIDLINVAFEKHCNIENNNRKRRSVHKFTNSQAVSVEENTFLVPDRISGKQALSDLKKLYPNRKWNFIQIDVTQEELSRERSGVISDLIHPLNTILDESLGCALWFASRGRGYLNNEVDNVSCKTVDVSYNSPARILLLGMGADELFGGYKRHRVAFQNSGWSQLKRELEMDLARISSRNLGRDDRIISDHGSQGRFPYLDESVVAYVTSLEPWHRCCPTSAFPPGVGDKLLLRLVAWKMGLHYSASLPKRAFQFGSRIANSKENGNDISPRLQQC